MNSTRDLINKNSTRDLINNKMPTPELEELMKSCIINLEMSGIDLLEIVLQVISLEDQRKLGLWLQAEWVHEARRRGGR